MILLDEWKEDGRDYMEFNQKAEFWSNRGFHKPNGGVFIVWARLHETHRFIKKNSDISIRRRLRKTKAELGLGLLLRKELAIDGAEQSLHRMATIAVEPVAGVNKFLSSVEFRCYGGQLITFALVRPWMYSVNFRIDLVTLVKNSMILMIL